MDEILLHYIWQYQKFTSHELRLTDGNRLTVFYPGYHNEDSGPDFSDARIKIENIQWIGRVEIHLKSSDWIRHGHHLDHNYDNVILHVVWKHDKVISILNAPIPTLELHSIVDPELLSKYEKKFPGQQKIPCESQMHSVDSIFINTMMERTGVERLNRKATEITEELQLANNDWDEIAYRKLAANYGFSTNKEAFKQLALNLPFHLLKKELHNRQSARALLWGQAGFFELQHPTSLELCDQYQFLCKKYSLKSPNPLTLWKFGRLRPANSPTTRIEQLATFLTNHPRPFSQLMEPLKASELIEAIRSDSQLSNSHHIAMGNMSAENILINTAAPLLAAYALYVSNQDFMDRAVHILEQVKPEQNRITKCWGSSQKATNAFQSQAQLELITNYCFKRRCLRCSIGVKLLNG